MGTGEGQAAGSLPHTPCGLPLHSSGCKPPLLSNEPFWPEAGPSSALASALSPGPKPELNHQLPQASNCIQDKASPHFPMFFFGGVGTPLPPCCLGGGGVGTAEYMDNTEYNLLALFCFAV